MTRDVVRGLRDADRDLALRGVPDDVQRRLAARLSARDGAPRRSQRRSWAVAGGMVAVMAATVIALMTRGPGTSNRIGGFTVTGATSNLDIQERDGTLEVRDGRCTLEDRA